jgi:hypothetical protein
MIKEQEKDNLVSKEDLEIITETLSESKKPVQKSNKLYILVAIIAAILIATANTLKSVVSSNPMAALNWYCLSHLVLSTLCLIGLTLLDRRKFRLPCMRRQD